MRGFRQTLAVLHVFVVLVLAQALLLVGSPEVARDFAYSNKIEPIPLVELRKKANRLYTEGAFNAAAELYADGYQRSLSAHAWNSAIVFLNNLAGTEFATYRYRAALDAFLKARKLAQDHKGATNLGAICFNLSALYLAVGDLASSRAAAEQGLQAVRNKATIGFRAQLLEQLGSVKAREGDAVQAARYFREAIDSAAQASDNSVLSMVLEKSGEEMLNLGSYREAEPYLTEAFRLRKLFRDRDLRTSYLFLSRLKLAQGDFRSAGALVDVAYSMPARAAGPPPWNLYFQRGLVRQAEGRIREAVDSFQQALNSARDWRQEAAPTDPSGTGTDISLQRLYRGYIDARFELRRSPAEELFLAAEEDRAASLRQSFRTLRTRDENSAPQYWEKLAQLRRAQAEVIVRDTPETRSQVERVRYELNEMEAKERLHASTPDSNRPEEESNPSATLRDIQRRVLPEEALLSLYRGEKRCYLWAVTRDHFEFHVLPPSAQLVPLAAQFRLSVETGSGDRNRIGALLYQLLFGELSREVENKHRWLLSADDALFEAPLAALVVRNEGDRPVHLVEEHSTERIAGAFLMGSSSGRLSAGRFLGIGDGIYNTADPRWVRSTRVNSSLQLARLVASGQELKSCAAQWNDEPPVLLTGPEASRRSLEAALRAQPAVIHIAAHFLYPREKPDQAFIDLGLARSGESEVLTREDIGNLSASGSMVVLSGCSSAATRSVAGAGVMGLTRAWLIAGASVVIGSRWPTPDDTGELFRSFYQRLRIHGEHGRSIHDVADGLRHAQLEMLRSATWRANPSYWAAFYIVGKE